MKNLVPSLALMMMSPAVSEAAVIYSNSFDNGSTPAGLTTSSIATVGWNTRYGNSTTTMVTPGTTGSYISGYADGTSPTGTPLLTDYIYVQKATTTTTDIDYILRTNDSAPSSPFVGLTPFAPSSYTSLTVAWQRNGGNNVAGHHFMIQTGGNWYVSTAAYTEFGAGQSGQPLLDLLATGWTNLDVTDDFLSIGATPYTYSDLFGAGQTITGIGFYVDDLTTPTSGLQSFRLDNIVIDAVPEPSAVLLSALGGLFLLRRRK